MCTERRGGKRQVIADVIEACSNTSRLEVITDVTVIRSSLPPCPGTALYSQRVTSAGRSGESGNGVTDGAGEQKAGTRSKVQLSRGRWLKLFDLYQHFIK